MYRVQIPGNYGGAFGTWDFHVFLSHRVAKVIGTWDFRGAKIFFFPAPGSDCDRDQEGSFRGGKNVVGLVPNDNWPRGGYKSSRSFRKSDGIMVFVVLDKEPLARHE